jgi:uroporphyrinogen III methyltransferase/synthase
MLDNPSGTVKVYLVGAGPGDPGLITVKGLECVRAADVIVYDRLIGREILDEARPDAELIYCGKGPGNHALTQEQINAVLVEKASQGNVVCRLKGGDPFVFGRGGEEALELQAHGIKFEVVPGVSSAIAAGAYAGIPVTQRGLVTSFTVATGHEDVTREESQLAWRNLAQAGGTLVILMGVGRLEEIVPELIAGGKSPDTPVALVASATCPEQRTLVSTLQDVAADARAQDVRPPAVMIVGDVVALREKLSWFEDRPLFGRRVLVTRTREQASELSALLRVHGAVPVEMPVLRLVPPETWEPFDAALRQAETYDWLVFTSANGVRFTRERLEELGSDLRALKGPRVAAIGPKTAAAAQSAGLRVSACPDEYIAESLVAALEGEGLSGQRVLLLRAADARSTFPEMARALGAEVDVVTVYRTVPVDEPAPRAISILESGALDAVTFASSSSVKNFAEAVGIEKARSLLENVTVACIGPVTAETAAELGLNVVVMPDDYTIEGLVAALVDHFAVPDRRSAT